MCAFLANMITFFFRSTSSNAMTVSAIGSYFSILPIWRSFFLLIVKKWLLAYDFILYLLCSRSWMGESNSPWLNLSKQTLLCILPLTAVRSWQSNPLFPIIKTKFYISSFAQKTFIIKLQRFWPDKIFINSSLFIFCRAFFLMKWLCIKYDGTTLSLLSTYISRSF